MRRIEPRHALLRCASSASQSLQPGSGMRFVRAEEAEPDQRIVQLVGIGGLGPGLGSHPRDRLGIEPAEVGGVLGREPAPAHHRLGAALLQRRIVEIGIGPRRQHLERQRRGLGQVARDDADVARLDAREQPLEAVDVHRLVEAVGDGLADQRMVRDLALADEVLGAGDLVGKHRRRSGPRRPCARAAAAPSCRRGSAAAPARRRSTQRQRVMNIGASSIAWISSGRTRGGMQVARRRRRARSCARW